MSTLSALTGGACPYQGQWLTCNSGAERYCTRLGQGYAGGFIQQYDIGSGNAVVACRRGRSIGTNMNVLNALSGGSCPTSAPELTCQSASQVFCQRNGYDAGGIQEYDIGSRNVTVLCTKATLLHAQMFELSGVTGNLCPSTNFWLTCNSAAQVYCAQRGYGGGGIVQQYNAGTGDTVLACF